MIYPESYHFYKNLEVVEDFTAIVEQQHYQPVPDDWVVVITDVIGSTKAIEAGKYKEVNISGGIAAMAIANVYEDLDFPFIFGGDGITFIIPSISQDKIRDILADTREVVRNTFELDLRVGFMSVKEIYDNGYRLDIAKLKVSRYYNQANISGEGLDWAESRLKDRRPDNPYLVPPDHKPQQKANFKGFTCRWQDIISSKGETIALIVKVREGEENKMRQTLQKIFEEIDDLLGAEENYHPLSEQNLKMALGDYLNYETNVQTRSKRGFKRWLVKQGIVFQAWATKLVLRFKLNIGVKVNDYHVKDLKQAQIIASDFRKYDGTLKMVISLNQQERQLFAKFLENCYQQGEIFYGVHVSDRALMTCLLHEGSTREVHFIDAADGGYAFAAKQMKAQIAAAEA